MVLLRQLYYIVAIPGSKVQGSRVEINNPKLKNVYIKYPAPFKGEPYVQRRLYETNV